ncbi:MAG TPA: hypothetical protein VMI72_09015 [Roseiarcus sp.]|nr:hypothetical protein [Roseiarcus sp.]
MTTDKVLDDLKGVGGAAIRTSLDHAKGRGAEGRPDISRSLRGGEGVLTKKQDSIDAAPSAAPIVVCRGEERKNGRGR